jgi:DNA-binding transcriptional MerR regulator
VDAVVPDKLYFRIGEVSELVGVEPHVLRYWETEFRMRPHRSSSGQRLYQKRDIERFLRIRKLLHSEGFTIAGARKMLHQGEAGAARLSSPSVELETLDLAAARLRTLHDELVLFREELSREDLA